MPLSALRRRVLLKNVYANASARVLLYSSRSAKKKLDLAELTY